VLSLHSLYMQGDHRTHRPNSNAVMSCGSLSDGHGASGRARKLRSSAAHLVKHLDRFQLAGAYYVQLACKGAIVPVVPPIELVTSHSTDKYLRKAFIDS
jgi:hypothetical protein